ncbi:hypothetical protein FB451DRAFT_1413629 [Mycena latifolia]|nr:hypothetical protein FB451DRAFT_1413629 [Mycena latifolia]
MILLFDQPPRRRPELSTGVVNTFHVSSFTPHPSKDRTRHLHASRAYSAAPKIWIQFLRFSPASVQACAPDAPPINVPRTAPPKFNLILWWFRERGFSTPRYMRPRPPPSVNPARRRHSIIFWKPRGQGYDTSEVTCAQRVLRALPSAERGRDFDSIFRGPGGGDTRRGSRAARSTNFIFLLRAGGMCSSSHTWLMAHRTPTASRCWTRVGRCRRSGFRAAVGILGSVFEFREEIRNALCSFRVSPTRFLNEYDHVGKVLGVFSRSRTRRVLRARTRAALRLDFSRSREWGYAARVARRGGVKRVPVTVLAAAAAPPTPPCRAKMVLLLLRAGDSHPAPPSFCFPCHLYGKPSRNSAASHAHSTTRHILAPSAMNSTDYLERTALRRWYTAAFARSSCHFT